MMAILSILVTILVAALLMPIVWVVAFYDHKQYTKLRDLEDQRRNLARKIVTEASSSDWLTRWRFKRYMRGGGNHL